MVEVNKINALLFGSSGSSGSSVRLVPIHWVSGFRPTAGPRPSLTAPKADPLFPPSKTGKS